MKNILELKHSLIEDYGEPFYLKLIQDKLNYIDKEKEDILELLDVARNFCAGEWKQEENFKIAIKREYKERNPDFPPELLEWQLSLLELALIDYKLY